MPKIANNNRAIMLAVTTALASTALAGCATHAAPRAEYSASKAQTAMAKGKASKAVSHAEAAVLADPRNPAYRAMLGASYMEAGRFQSAATSFQDAMTLGDESARTALSYALAEIAAGDFRAAQSTLDAYSDDIDASDLGLAFALAGDPERGVHILGNAIRGGQNTAKVRQNLAYSYALKGDWRSARLMAAEDVPAGQINNRIAEWAETSAPQNTQARVAKLLNVPLVGDSGQPAQLALANHPSTQMLANEAAAQAPVQAPSVVAQASAASYELPPLAADLPAAKVSAPAAASSPVAPQGKPDRFADAFADAAPAKPQNAKLAESAKRFVSNPVVQDAPAPRTVKTGQAESHVATGDHLVQLGSFSSEAAAKRAWGIYTKRYSQLANYDMVITKAKVRGKTYFRVSAGGFQKASARKMCSSVKSRNQGCITWAANRPLPGATDAGIRMASR